MRTVWTGQHRALRGSGIWGGCRVCPRLVVPLKLHDIGGGYPQHRHSVAPRLTSPLQTALSILCYTSLHLFTPCVSLTTHPTLLTTSESMSNCNLHPCYSLRATEWRCRGQPLPFSLVNATESRSDDVVDNPCRPQRSKGARGKGATKKVG